MHRQRIRQATERTGKSKIRLLVSLLRLTLEAYELSTLGRTRTSSLLMPSLPIRNYSVPATSRSGDDHMPIDLVGVAGFEPAASSSRTKRAAKLRYTPAPAPASARANLGQSNGNADPLGHGWHPRRPDPGHPGRISRNRVPRG